MTPVLSPAKPAYPIIIAPRSAHPIILTPRSPHPIILTPRTTSGSIAPKLATPLNTPAPKPAVSPPSTLAPKPSTYGTQAVKSPSKQTTPVTTPVISPTKPVNPGSPAATTVNQPELKKEDPNKSSNPATEIFFRCQNCKNVILGPNAENLYVEHITTCLDTNNYECSICFKKFAHKRGLTNHLRLTHLVFD